MDDQDDQAKDGTLQVPKERKRKSRQKSSLGDTLTSRSRTKKKSAAVGRISFLHVLRSEADSAMVLDKSKTSEDVNLISNAFKQYFIFANLSDELLLDIIQAMKLYILLPDSLIYEEGASGSSFFILIKGQLTVLNGESTVCTLTQGASFGELALIHESLRTNTIRTITDSELWGIDRNTFKELVSRNQSQLFQDNRNFVERVAIFQFLTSEQKDNLVQILIPQDFPPGQVIVREGDVGDSCFLIKEGSVSCRIGGEDVRALSAGDVFGEQALIHEGVRTATVQTQGPVKCLALYKDDMTDILGDQLLTIISKNSIIIALNKSEVLASLTKLQINTIVENMKIRNYQKGHVVIPLPIALPLGITTCPIW